MGKLINSKHLETSLIQFKTYIDTKFDSFEVNVDVDEYINAAKTEVLNTVAASYVNKTDYNQFATITESNISIMNTTLTNVRASAEAANSDLVSVRQQILDVNSEISTLENDINNTKDLVSDNSSAINSLESSLELLAMPGFRYVQGEAGNVTLVWVG